MKKNFFKKLSFVMASAMVLSVISPAAGAFAAAAPALNATSTKYLYLGDEDKDEFDFNIKNKDKKAGWTYEWSSSNEKVAVVDKAGNTTAVGAGTAKITVVITDKNGDVVDTLTGKVTVRDNIKELTITNLPEKDTLTIGKEHDFNRTYVTDAGKKKGSEAVTRWVVDGEGATINDKGVFVAEKPGEYTITANAFQSKSKYTSWLADKEANADFVTATTSYKVTVVETMKGAKQVNSTKIAVEFDADMKDSDFAKTVKVYQIINGKQVETSAEKVKAVTFEGNVATLELFAGIKGGTVYNVVYGEAVADFKGAKKDVAEIAGIVFDTVDVDVEAVGGTDMSKSVYAINKDGVKIYEGTEIAAQYLTFTYGGQLVDGFASGKTIYMHKAGTSAPVSVKFSRVTFNDTTKAYETIEFSANSVAVAFKQDKNISTATLQFAVATAQPDKDSSAWGLASTVPANEVFNIYTRYKNAHELKDDYKVVSGTSLFVYESSNTDKAIISGGSIYTIAPGTVTILVKNKSDNTVVGTFDIAIVGARAFASVTIDKTNVNIGNNAKNGEEDKFTLTTIDTMGSAIHGKDVLVTGHENAVNKPSANANQPSVTPSVDAKGKVVLTVSAKGATSGYYGYKVKVKALTVEKEITFTVIVGEANDTSVKADALVVVDYKLAADSTNVDLKDGSKSVQLNVYGYNSAGYAVTKLDANQYSVKVNNKDNSNISFLANEVGSYAVTAFVSGAGVSVHGVDRVPGSYLGGTTITVVDTTKKELVRKTTVVTAANIVAAANAAFDFKVNDDQLDAVKVSYSAGRVGLATGTVENAVASGNTVYIDTVTVKDANGREYTFDVKTTIAIQ